MVQHEEDEEPRRDEDAPELAVDADAPADVPGDMSGRSFDELADRARAAIEREHLADHADLEPDDASLTAQAQASPPRPDADDRPV
ncbi:hypothetical protein ACIQC8_09730 [Agrococcus sediminis]|jgi:hypothetical protein|uniref:hypothetical protein n=1 Tax=Agrococcus TaxID=46352 RepID=UPI000FE2E84B|nr:MULTISPECIES: hypothetical protein [unclassified Agrococcus]MDR7233398.1 hypothetical protein [Agrococcus sp. BE272]RWR15821.1 hypothetical protein D8Y24_13380 [Agrococcus lahaulensis]UOW02060.1 hypothetical protein MU522_06605 [Agrococcus sp. SCSIO52902]